MFAFRDFVPKQLHAPRLGFSATAQQGEYETLDAALLAANEWIAREGVRVVNLETVVLPSIWEHWETGSRDPVLTSTAGAPLWYQVIRVWYEAEG